MQYKSKRASSSSSQQVTMATTNNNTEDKIVQMRVAFKRQGRYVGTNWFKSILASFVDQLTHCYCHCEMVFVTEQTKYYHFVVTPETPVSVFEKTDLDYNDWHFYTIDASEQQANKAYAFCIEKMDCPFNGLGLYMNFLPILNHFAVSGNDESFFCSELVIRALQVAMPADFLDMNAHKTSPYDFYKYMRKHCVAPFNFHEAHVLRQRNRTLDIV